MPDPQPTAETPPPQTADDTPPQSAVISTTAEIFKAAIDQSNALHAQALQDIQSRSDEVNVQLQSVIQQRVGALLLPHFAYVQRAATLDAEFWPGIVESAKQVLRTHGEFPVDTPAN